MSTISFEHHMAAHCETGALISLLGHAGMPLSEAMAFGIGSGIFFAYLDPASFPFRRLPFPMFVPRTEPGKIRERLAKRLGIHFSTSRFRNRQKASLALDALLDRRIPVGVQVDMFYMEYIPPYMKAHFNGHYVIVVGKDNGSYKISDCYYPELADLSEAALLRGRFARGDMAPRGFLFYPQEVPASFDLKRAIVQGIRESCRNMLKLPLSFLGVRGIRQLAQKVVTWPDLAMDSEHLSHEIVTIHITLEERGTGGAGFRFMYATFLQQASQILSNDELAELSREMMGIGDRWREISLFVARIGKKRDLGPERLKELQGMILQRADDEETFFRKLSRAVP